MEIYTVCLAFIVAGGMLVEFKQTNKRKYTKVYLVLVGIIWTFFATFRAQTVGTDLVEYLRVLHGSADRYGFETGYLLFNDLLMFLGCSDELFLFLVAVIIYIPVLVSVFRYSESPWISVTAFFSLQFWGLTLTAVRQMMALSILLMGIPYILDKDLKKWIIITLLALSFHKSAIVAFPLYWCTRGNRIRRGWKVFLCGEIILFAQCIWWPYLYEFIYEFMPRYAPYLLENLFTAPIGDYVILYILHLLIWMGVNTSSFHDAPQKRLYIKSLMISCMIIIMSFSTGNIFKRLNFYFLYFIILFLPVVCCRLGQGKQNILVKFFVVASLAFYFYYQMSLDGLKLCPYKFSF